MVEGVMLVDKSLIVGHDVGMSVPRSIFCLHWESRISRKGLAVSPAGMVTTTWGTIKKGIDG